MVLWVDEKENTSTSSFSFNDIHAVVGQDQDGHVFAVLTQNISQERPAYQFEYVKPGLCPD
jgi:hypothetical protein